tara:strand:+ start:2606 stop:3205 length:600 start_codon:yes stop_codon:yes gene_type:complete
MSSENPETRTRILDAALALLGSGRGSAARMADIARQAGISRQAVYLHFSTRAELLIAATLYLDEVKGIDDRLAASRAAETGAERLDAFIDAWGNYIPEIYGIARALLAMKDTDEAAAAAWDGRMQAVREGCAACIDMLAIDGVLSPDLPPQRATDLLWTMLSVRNWEQLTVDCRWPQRTYIETTKRLARDTFVVTGTAA